MEFRKIGDFSLNWGESLRWDDVKQRLYFVDCATCQLFWLDNAELPLHSITLSSLPTGIGLVEDGRLLIAMQPGLVLVDPETGAEELLAVYPEALGIRANDATVDSQGNLVTGTLNISPGVGSYWWYSNKLGWRQLDDDISNANGPVTLVQQGRNKLLFADTPAQKIYAYDYDPKLGVVGNRSVYGDVGALNGAPDGACATSAGGIISCVIGPGLLAHYKNDGSVESFAAGSEQPSDVTFGGVNLDTLFVVNINSDIGRGAPKSKYAGSLIAIEGSGLTGRVENRFVVGG